MAAHTPTIAVYFHYRARVHEAVYIPKSVGQTRSLRGQRRREEAYFRFGGFVCGPLTRATQGSRHHPYTLAAQQRQRRARPLPCVAWCAGATKHPRVSPARRRNGPPPSANAPRVQQPTAAMHMCMLALRPPRWHARPRRKHHPKPHPTPPYLPPAPTIVRLRR